MRVLTGHRVVTALGMSGLLVATLWLSSCDNDTPVSCPTFQVGAVEGFVLVAGQGISAVVGARAMEGDNRGEVLCSTQSDSTGWYRLDLQTGLYRIQVNPSGGIIYSPTASDTLRVTPHVHRHNLELGRAEILVLMPSELEDRRFTLRMRSRHHFDSYEAASVQDGLLEFEFPILQSGTYTMLLELLGVGHRFYLPGSMEPDDADTLTVDTESTATYEATFVDTYASITGNISGSWQEVQAHAPTVEAYSVADSIRIGVAQCESDGSFLVDIFLPEEVRLSTEITRVRQWIGGDSFRTARVFDVQPGDRITDASFVESGILAWLEGPGELTSYSGMVALLEDAGREYSQSFYGDNPIFFCNLKPGRYYLHVHGYCDRQIWAPQWFDGAESVENATSMDLQDGELRRLTLRLIEGGRIEGRVLTWDGWEPEWVRVGIYDSLGEPLCSHSQTCTDGILAFPGLADGDYYLAASLIPQGLWWYPGTADFNSATPITITDHLSVEDVTWSLPQDEKEPRP